ncbi:MAG: DUF362 domain-containing protein [Prolixibacteraceae bacterium]|nr:DUF362 domain-containing protein [Prolixibacteraceae bacterium]
MITNERIQKFPNGIKRTLFFLKKLRVPGKIVFLLISLFATIWFLIRVIPKPSRATYPCMQVAAPMMSGFVIWILTLSGAAFAFKKAKNKLFEAKYLAAGLFLVIGMATAAIFSFQSPKEVSAADLKIWYKPNVPLGVAKGMFPGRVAWGHNPKIASWDEKNGFWWEDRFNNQEETDKLFSQTLLSLTNVRNEKKSWDVLFRFFNKTKKNSGTGYKQGEKVAIKINQNNTSSHESSGEINANPAMILSLMRSLVNKAGIAEENITVADPSRFITNNIYDKCYAVYPKVHYIDHIGGDGREQSTFVENGFVYSQDFKGMVHGLATCFVEADYVINLAIMKGHVAQGVTLCAKNFFGCTSIETDWHKNSHGSGFSQSKAGKPQYSVYPDFIGHKDLGGKTVLYLIDGVYSNKGLGGLPKSKWTIPPFNNEWMGSLFASQDPVAIESVVLDFALAAWPDAPDMMYSDYAMEEMALANNPPSGAVYDPERDGTPLASLGTAEHWNNPTDKKYSRNLHKGNGIELIYKRED